jgi:hypothetical protein
MNDEGTLFRFSASMSVGIIFVPCPSQLEKPIAKENLEHIALSKIANDWILHWDKWRCNCLQAWLLRRKS